MFPKSLSLIKLGTNSKVNNGNKNLLKSCFLRGLIYPLNSTDEACLLMLGWPETQMCLTYRAPRVSYLLKICSVPSVKVFPPYSMLFGISWVFLPSYQVVVLLRNIMIYFLS